MAKSLSPICPSVHGTHIIYDYLPAMLSHYTCWLVKLYLDDRHLEWMTDRTLQSVISDLRPLIGPKLEAERYAHYGPGGPATVKRGTVEVHRGDHYQFAYFLRKAEPHAVVLKWRNYVQVENPVQPEVRPPNRPRGKRKPRESPSDTQDHLPTSRAKKRPREGPPSTKTRKTARHKGKDKAMVIIDDSEEEKVEESSLSDLEDSLEDDDDGNRQASLRRLTRKEGQAYRENSDNDDDFRDINQYEDAEMQEGSESSPRVKIEESLDPVTALGTGIDENEEETKKLGLQLAFRGLSMRNRCLCVIVEPWPPLPVTTSNMASESNAARASSITRGFDKEPSVSPSQFASSNILQREQTPLPLFLPNLDQRDRSATPAPRFPSVFSSLNTIDEAQHTMEDDDEFGMLAFSQVLNNVAGDHSGGIDEDDEMDGSALYGDADEMRNNIQ